MYIIRIYGHVYHKCICICTSYKIGDWYRVFEKFMSSATFSTSSLDCQSLMSQSSWLALNHFQLSTIHVQSSQSSTLTPWVGFKYPALESWHWVVSADGPCCLGQWAPLVLHFMLLIPSPADKGIISSALVIIHLIFGTRACWFFLPEIFLAYSSSISTCPVHPAGPFWFHHTPLLTAVNS